MNQNKWILLRYEFKKIISRRSVWISLVISTLLILVTVGASLLGSSYVDGENMASNYETFLMDRVYQLVLDGRAIDEELLEEMQVAYGKVNLADEKYSSTAEYQKYARPYSAVYNFVRQNTGKSGKVLMLPSAGIEVKVSDEKVQAGEEAVVGEKSDGTGLVATDGWKADAESLREMRLALREVRWEEYLLTEGEKEFWREQEERIESPVIFRYAEGYSVLISAGYTVGLLVIFMVAICLSGVFAEEHVRRTDQLILSSRLGRGDVFWAKFGAGILFAFLLSLLFAGVTVGTAFMLYGAEGFDGAFQLIYAGSSLPISVGEAVLIAYTCVVFAGVFTGALTLLLSQVTNSGVATLGIIVGMIMLPMYLVMPEEYRILGQLWSYLPSDFVAVWSIFSPQTVPVFGVYLQAWQAVPILYVILGIVFALVGKRSFVKYQVSGR